MKFFFITLLVILLVLAFHYLPTFYPHGSGTCPEGSRYVRSAIGGGWVDTDATDPWGQCISQSEIDKATNQ